MTDASPAPPEVPHAHEGAHYSNPSSKPLEGPISRADRDGVQRVVWPLFYFLIASAVTLGVVLGLLHARP